MRKIKIINRRQIDYRKLSKLCQLEVLEKNKKTDLIDFILRLENTCSYYEEALRIIAKKNFYIRLKNREKILVRPNDIINGPHAVAEWVLRGNRNGIIHHQVEV
jgi:hypothetical protein